MEIIGLILQVAFAMALALVAGIAGAAFVVSTIKQQITGRIHTAVLAGLLPTATVVYLFAFRFFLAILSPSLGGSDLLFGDGNEPLPNGYTIHYLGKMPSAGWIQQKPQGVYGIGDVAALQVFGSRIAGRYDHTYSGEPPANYFLFDTATGKNLDFQTEEELEHAVNAPVHLTETQHFHGQEPASQRAISWLWFIVALGPPGLSALWLIRQWLRLRALGKAEGAAPTSS